MSGYYHRHDDLLTNNFWRGCVAVFYAILMLGFVYHWYKGVFNG
jgi:NADH:ubiquinone oxidoreductase subunit 3 (subunit A)